MHRGETKEETLKREINEELGTHFKYQICEQSYWYIIYDWPQNIQLRQGYIGQARTSYWVKYIEGEITLAQNELNSFIWVDETNLREIMINGGFPIPVIENLLRELKIIKQKYL